MAALFQPIGQKAENVAPAAANNGTDVTDEEQDVKPVDEIESLCMNCHENGITRILLTKIPYFREVIIMSFACGHCGLQNNEVQTAGTIQLKGARYEMRLTTPADLQRQVIKSDSAVVKFTELDVEIPAGRGLLTTIEGLLTSMVDDLESNQEDRKTQAPDVYTKVEQIISRGRAMLAGEAFPFRLTVDDPTGNSFIQPDPRDGVGKWEKREYLRSTEQNLALGLADTSNDEKGLDPDGNIVPDEVYQFPATCPGCMHPCTTNMKMVEIPHFRQVVLMNTSCEACGYKSNDVKTGGEIPERGKRVTLRVKTDSDLARDILKSESCSLECPELSLAVNPGTLGGRFTTVEGLLTQVRNDLHNQIFESSSGDETKEGGDSLASDEKRRWTEFFEKLDSAIAGKYEFTIILTDPLAMSYVQSLGDDPEQPDAQMQVEEYQRSYEEEEDLGLKDMKVEDYGGDVAGKSTGGSD